MNTGEYSCNGEYCAVRLIHLDNQRAENRILILWIFFFVAFFSKEELIGTNYTIGISFHSSSSILFLNKYQSVLLYARNTTLMIDQYVGVFSLCVLLGWWWGGGDGGVWVCVGVWGCVCGGAFICKFRMEQDKNNDYLCRNFEHSID